MFKLWRFTLFFLLCLVLALLVNLPIQHVLARVKLPNTLSLDGVDGTVVHGNAQEVNVNGFPLRDVTYRYMPSCIPLLKVCYRVAYTQGTVQVAYDMLNGDTEINKLRIEYPASEIAQYMTQIPVRPDGKLELVIEDLTMVGNKPTSLAGTLFWRDLGLDDDGIKFNVGDIKVDFTGNAQQYDFKINDLDAALDVDGDGEISAGGQYKVDIKIRSELGIDSNVRSILDLVAKRVSLNNYRIEQSGRLPPQIARQLFR